MKKRLLSLTMALVMCISLLPVPASAVSGGTGPKAEASLSGAKATDYKLIWKGNGALTDQGEELQGVLEQSSKADYVSFDLSDIPVPVREAYAFTGWNTAADGSGTPHAETETLVVTQADPVVELYAQWVPVDSDADILIDYKTFPDRFFRDYLNTLPGAEDGRFHPSEIAQIKSITCENYRDSVWHTGLTGIEHFTALEELTCYGGWFNDLDLTAMKNLKYLKLEKCRLNTLDLTGLTSLEKLDCTNNPLPSLDLSTNTGLTELRMGDNEMTQIDLSANQNLENLVIDYFYLTPAKLTSLDLSHNTALKSLMVCDIPLSELDLSHNYRLDHMILSNLPLQSLNLRGTDQMSHLQITDVPAADMDLDLNSKKLLAYFQYGGAGLTEVDLSHNRNLQYAFVGDASTLTDLNVSGLPRLMQLEVDSSALKVVDVRTNQNLKNHVRIMPLEHDITLLLRGDEFPMWEAGLKPEMISDLRGVEQVGGVLKVNADVERGTFTVNGHTVTLIRGEIPAPVETTAKITYRVIGGNWLYGDAGREDIVKDITLVDGIADIDFRDVEYPGQADPELGENAGGEWFPTNPNYFPVVEDTTFTYIFNDGDPNPKISYVPVTFKVKNGTWADGTTADKTVMVRQRNGRGTLLAEEVPVGMIARPGLNCGSWDVEPEANTVGITDAVTYTYTFCSHTHKAVPVAGQAPTCTADGWKDYYTCSCGKFFEDKACTRVITDLEKWKTGDGRLEQIPHEYGEWKQDDTNHWKECSSCHSIINKAAHTYGDWVVVTPATTTEKGLEKRVCSVCGHEETRAIPMLEKPVTNPFTDVKETDWYFDPVMWAVEKDITNGMTPTEFGAFEKCNRAQIVTFLWSAAGKPAPTLKENPFTDVPEGAWFHDAVLWAVEKGITGGMTPTTFGPTATCNRAQAVTFLWKYMEEPDASAKLQFTDVKEGAWYYRAVRWAVENGITSGLSSTEFGTTADCLRSQIVTFMYKALN